MKHARLRFDKEGGRDNRHRGAYKKNGDPLPRGKK